jgi:hypothetical protein
MIIRMKQDEKSKIRFFCCFYASLLAIFRYLSEITEPNLLVTLAL